MLSLPVVVVVSVLLVGAADDAGDRERWWPSGAFRSWSAATAGSLVSSVLVSLGSTVVALVALLLSLPLWFVPPLVLMLPPLIWGWLTYRVMSLRRAGRARRAGGAPRS